MTTLTLSPHHSRLFLTGTPAERDALQARIEQHVTQSFDETVRIQTADGRLAWLWIGDTEDPAPGTCTGWACAAAASTARYGQPLCADCAEDLDSRIADL